VDPEPQVDTRPRWLRIFADLVRPGGVTLMLLFLTIIPLIFAILELGIEGVGIRLAGVLAGYFKAIPDAFYTTLQVLFLGYVAGKSGEAISRNISNKQFFMVNKPEEENNDGTRTKIH
jgi:hypothetical protein